MTKRQRLAGSKIDLRFGWVVLLALAAQLVVIYVGFGEAGIVRRLVFPASYLVLLTFIVLNRRRLGFVLIGVGALLNLLVIVSNGGLMPITPANLEKAGLGDKLAELELGDSVPMTKNVLLDESETHLQPLSDRFSLWSSGPVSVFSIGDAVIGAGLIVVLLQLLFPVFQRASPDQPSLT